MFRPQAHFRHTIIRFPNLTALIDPHQGFVISPKILLKKKILKRNKNNPIVEPKNVKKPWEDPFVLNRYDPRFIGPNKIAEEIPWESSRS
jgi:hypothetical protein